MHLEGIFSGLSALAMIGWLALAVAPLQRSWCVAFARILALLLAAAYLAQFFLTTEHVDGGGFSTLAGVAALFSNPGNLMMGWTHYLAIDLFTGLWIGRDADAKGFSRLVQVPFLLATFMFGPVGLLGWLIVREARARAAARG